MALCAVFKKHPHLGNVGTNHGVQLAPIWGVPMPADTPKDGSSSTEGLFSLLLLGGNGHKPDAGGRASLIMISACYVKGPRFRTMMRWSHQPLMKLRPRGRNLAKVIGAPCSTG